MSRNGSVRNTRYIDLFTIFIQPGNIIVSPVFVEFSMKSRIPGERLYFLVPSLENIVVLRIGFFFRVLSIVSRSIAFVVGSFIHQFTSAVPFNADLFKFLPNSDKLRVSVHSVKQGVFIVGGSQFPVSCFRGYNPVLKQIPLPPGRREFERPVRIVCPIISEIRRLFIGITLHDQLEIPYPPLCINCSIALYYKGVSEHVDTSRSNRVLCPVKQFVALLIERISRYVCSASYISI